MTTIEKRENFTLSTGRSISLSAQELGVVQTLNTYNQLRNFKLTDIEQLEWKDSLLKRVPNLDPKALELAVEAMMDGRLPYDPYVGIQNIFKALGRIVVAENGYRILPEVY